MLCFQKRNNPASRIFTRQPEVERVLAKINESADLQLLSSVEEATAAATNGKNVENDSDFPGNCDDQNNGTKIEWSSMPRDVHPMGGELPFDRIEKKCDQVSPQKNAMIAWHRFNNGRNRLKRLLCVAVI